MAFKEFIDKAFANRIGILIFVDNLLEFHV